MTPGNTSTSKALVQLLSQRSRGIRNLKDIEVYLKAHYKEKIQPLVEEDVQENQLDSKQRISVVRKYTNRCFAAESEEVKAEIHEETTRINAARRLGNIVSDKRTKEEIYCAIQELPIVLGQICEDLAALMGGWHYTLVMGGPDPMCEGDIMALSFHHGKGRDGLSFKASNRNFHEQYLEPFEKHLRGVFGANPAQNDLLAIPSPLSPSLKVPAPPDFTAPNTQNNSEDLTFHVPADPKSSGTYDYPSRSLMDPNFTVSEAEINTLIASIPLLMADGPNGQWLPPMPAWKSPRVGTSFTAPPASTGSLIELPMPAWKSLMLPPVDTLDATSIPTAPDALLPAESVPPVSSSAPGRHSGRATQPSTRVENANKIGDNATSNASAKKYNEMSLSQAFCLRTRHHLTKAYNRIIWVFEAVIEEAAGGHAETSEDLDLC
ncbi:hypothetical protein DFH29DRAFT_874603 [Suillus ampliporus]|nr:hypothetical protein DFH29DRAFT_874603 [Suillus ampliporus]